MDSVAVTVPLRPPMKKMKKRKELDALAPPHAISRRSSGKRSSQELLTDSSDERSEYWNVSTRGNRKCRGQRSHVCPGLLRACSAFVACASVLATATLIWLFIDVRQQLAALRIELDQVVAGNEGVPDALQKCHSLSRDLQNNQTIIFTHLSDLKLQITNFSVQLSNIQHDLHQVQEWLNAAPELADMPQHLKMLSISVASFGSQIQDLFTTVNTLKKTNTRIQDGQTNMLQNISNIEHSLLELSNVTQKPQMLLINETKVKTEELNTTVSQLTSNLMSVNETLSRRLQWVVNDQKKDYNALDVLQEQTRNVSTKLMSLEGECAKQTTVLASVNKLTDQLNEARKTDVEFNEKLKKLELLYNSLEDVIKIMPASTSDDRNQQRIAEPKAKSFSQDQSEILTADTTTVTNRESPEAVAESMQRKPLTSKPKVLSSSTK